jgi:hypothetical protein
MEIRYTGIMIATVNDAITTAVRNKSNKYAIQFPGKAETRRQGRKTIHHRRRQIANEQTLENYRKQAHARAAYVRHLQNRKQRCPNRNEHPMIMTREFWYSSELTINLVSIVDHPKAESRSSLQRI